MRRLTYVVIAVVSLSLSSACLALGPTTGKVIDATGAPVANATVNLQGSNSSAVSDAEGNFVIHLDAQPSPVLRITKDGYARTSFLVTETNIDSIVVHLQPVDTVMTLTLPTTGQANAVVSVTRTDCKAELQIPANSLVTSSGAVASGNVTVTMTYWDGMRNMITSPGPLLGKADVAGAPPTPLHSVGMADIEIRQGNDLLQVAAGSYLPFNVTVPMTLRNFLSAPEHLNNTYLVWLDPNAALWEKVAPVNTPMFQYDAAMGQLQGLLPHLSSWNYDEFQTGVAGCVQGRVLDCSGNPIPNTPFLGWLMNIEGLYRTNWTTNSSGKYCEDVQVPTNDTATNGQWQFPIHLSGPDGPQDSNFPNVIPANCVTCVNDGLVESGYVNDCYCGTISSTVYTSDSYCPAEATGCAWVGQVLNASTPQESYNYDGVAADAIVTVQTGTTCESAPSSCFQLPDLVIGTCSGGTAITGNPCAAAQPKYQGASCGASSECCPTGTPLVCLDNLCVPDSD